MRKGTVKFFEHTFGYIVDDLEKDNKDAKDIWFHFSQITNSMYYKELHSGDRVIYDIISSNNGRIATNVTKITEFDEEGKPIVKLCYLDMEGDMRTVRALNFLRKAMRKGAEMFHVEGDYLICSENSLNKEELSSVINYLRDHKEPDDLPFKIRLC
jgi:cold shock CspA family protein